MFLSLISFLLPQAALGARPVMGLFNVDQTLCAPYITGQNPILQQFADEAGNMAAAALTMLAEAEQNNWAPARAYLNAYPKVPVGQNANNIVRCTLSRNPTSCVGNDLINSLQPSCRPLAIT